MSFVTFTLKEKNQIFNMRLITLTLQRCLHNEGYINVIEQQAHRQIAIEVNNKDDADKVQRWLDDEGLVY